MKLLRLRCSGFQSFGPLATEITFDHSTFIIGPNGSGKTAVLQALCRLFGFDPSLRRVQRSDFHVPMEEGADAATEERKLWLEAEFHFPELKEGMGDFAAIPPYFAHMRLDTADGVPRIRFRLDATLTPDGEIEEILNFVLDVDKNDDPLSKHAVPRPDRNNIQVHYLPARRDPSDHISYTANSLLGRVLRSVNWQDEREPIKELTSRISTTLSANNAVKSIADQLSSRWKSLHKGSYFTDPQVTFVSSEIDALLRHLSVTFTPAHGEELVDFSRLSDGQKSMLYLTLVLAIQRIGRSVLAGEEDLFDVEKLKPAVFTLIAMEEPENSLSPHYLGRVVQALTGFAQHPDAQSLIATHAPSMLRRVEPEAIRYLRLDESRQTKVSSILMPPASDEGHKFVREAVQAFPELYFSRLVVLGEGGSEEIVLHRLFNAMGLAADEQSISVVPLGGRHVNHFWRLLSGLGIPYVTLLDLDLARFQGGWGRIGYAWKQFIALAAANSSGTPTAPEMPEWNSDEYKVLEVEANPKFINYIEDLEARSIFFSSPLDLDFTMLQSFQSAYLVKPPEKCEPDEDLLKAVLGKRHHDKDQYSKSQLDLFGAYHKRFQLGSKPVAHIDALARLSDKDLVANAPASLKRMAAAVVAVLGALPE
jgi:putative ATP-dependent endonuclease of OLD family